MKYLISTLLCLLSVTVFAANPTYNSFLAADFTNNGVTIGINAASPKLGIGNTNANNIWSGVNRFNNSSNMFSGNVVTNLSTVYCVNTNSYFWNGAYYVFGNCDAMLQNLFTNSVIWGANTNGALRPLYGGIIKFGPFDYWFTNQLVWYITNGVPGYFGLQGDSPNLTRLLNNNTNSVPYGLIKVIASTNSFDSPEARFTYTPTINFSMENIGTFAADTTNCILLVQGFNFSYIRNCTAANIGALTNTGSGYGALQLGDVPYGSAGAVKHNLTLWRFRTEGDNGVDIHDVWLMGGKYGIVLDCDHAYITGLYGGGFRGLNNTNCAVVVDHTFNKSSFDTFHLVVNDIGILADTSIQGTPVGDDKKYSRIHIESVTCPIVCNYHATANKFQVWASQDVFIFGQFADHVLTQYGGSFNSPVTGDSFLLTGGSVQDTNYITITGSTIASVNGVYVRGYNIGKIGVWTNSAGSTNAIVQDDPTFNVLASVTNSLCLEATNLINTGNFLLLYYPASFTMSSANGAWSDNATADNNVFGSIRLIQTITITNSDIFIGNNGGVIEQKDVWLLHDVTNNMPNFSYKTANSNGAALVSIYMSNGIPHIKQLAP